MRSFTRRRANDSARGGDVTERTSREGNAKEMIATATRRVENAGGEIDLFSFFISLFLYAVRY